jgi:hypothetical protein
MGAIKPKSVYYVASHGGKWRYGKKGGVYSTRAGAIERARNLVKSGYAETVQVFESTPIEWTELEEF